MLTLTSPALAGIWLGAGRSAESDKPVGLDYIGQLQFEVRDEEGGVVQWGLGIERMQLKNRAQADDVITLYAGLRVPNRRLSPYFNLGAGWYGGDFVEVLLEVLGECRDTTQVNSDGSETVVESPCDSDVFLQYVEAGLELDLGSSWGVRAYARRNRFDTLSNKYLNSTGVQLGYKF